MASICYSVLANAFPSIDSLKIVDSQNDGIDEIEIISLKLIYMMTMHLCTLVNCHESCSSFAWKAKNESREYRMPVAICHCHQCVTIVGPRIASQFGNFYFNCNMCSVHNEQKVFRFFSFFKEIFVVKEM